jgi:D-glycero-D-manno-heptose 1,7-bisphosphate phosphatase
MSMRPTFPTMRRAIFVDRDGTLNPDLHYLADGERIELYPGVGEAIRLAHSHGFLVVCVTNQSGVERGYYTTDDVERMHTRLNTLLHREGTQIDGFYFCPHTPEHGCACRKPGTEMFERAARDFSIDLRTSAIIGDRVIDLQAGHRLSLVSALVPSPGHETETAKDVQAQAAHPEIQGSTFLIAMCRLLACG